PPIIRHSWWEDLRRPRCWTPREPVPATRGGCPMTSRTTVSSDVFSRTVGWMPRRVAVLSVHTSPLEQPGTGDAGGMNVYITQTAKEMARRGIAVEVFTRATSSDQPPIVEMTPGVQVRHVPAGPFEPLDRSELPGQLCAFTAGV